MHICNMYISKPFELECKVPSRTSISLLLAVLLRVGPRLYTGVMSAY